MEYRDSAFSRSLFTMINDRCSKINGMPDLFARWGQKLSCEQKCIVDWKQIFWRNTCCPSVVFAVSHGLDVMDQKQATILFSVLDCFLWQNKAFLLDLQDRTPDAWIYGILHIETNWLSDVANCGEIEFHSSLTINDRTWAWTSLSS